MPSPESPIAHLEEISECPVLRLLARGVVLHLGAQGHPRLLRRRPKALRDHADHEGVIVQPRVAAWGAN